MEVDVEAAFTGQPKESVKSQCQASWVPFAPRSSVSVTPPRIPPMSAARSAKARASWPIHASHRADGDALQIHLARPVCALPVQCTPMPVGIGQGFAVYMAS